MWNGQRIRPDTTNNQYAKQLHSEMLDRFIRVRFPGVAPLSHYEQRLQQGRRLLAGASPTHALEQAPHTEITAPFMAPPPRPEPEEAEEEEEEEVPEVTRTARPRREPQVELSPAQINQIESLPPRTSEEDRPFLLNKAQMLASMFGVEDSGVYETLRTELRKLLQLGRRPNKISRSNI